MDNNEGRVAQALFEAVVGLFKIFIGLIRLIIRGSRKAHEKERASLSAKDRKATFVYIDEAADYFDQRLEQLCNQARKYKVGLILAHQNLDQFDTRLRATVMASTTTGSC